MVSDPAPELFAAYSATRARMASLAESLSPTDLRRTVPACPSWTVFDLMAHVVSMPAAIGRGERPPGTVTEWLQSLVEARRDQTVGELTEEWLTLDGAISSILNGPGGVLFGDLAVHEHDVRGAVGAPDHSALEVEVMLPRTLAAFASPLRAAGLGAIEVRHGDRTWRSHEAIRAGRSTSARGRRSAPSTAVAPPTNYARASTRAMWSPTWPSSTPTCRCPRRRSASNSARSFLTN
jgi:hypothetical protein